MIVTGVSSGAVVFAAVAAAACSAQNEYLQSISCIRWSLGQKKSSAVESHSLVSVVVTLAIRSRNRDRSQSGR